MEFKNIKFEVSENICTITMNRPKALNALNRSTLEELDQALDLIEKDKRVSLLVLTGEGKSFVAGADIVEMRDKTPGEAASFSKFGADVFRRIEKLEMPVIAAVNGFALGGGCELAMCCDIRIASEKAKFGQPETGLGLTPGFSGTQRLARLVGPGKAKELIFSCRVIDGREAERIGLVNQVVQPEVLMQTVYELAYEILGKGQIAVRYSKEAINRGLETDIDTAIDIEKNLFALCFATEDQKEGMAAFTEKRKPEFRTK
ncbi:MAG TPA: short-chain-enoyl-CoA hydratase [Clostridiaceae bacterium]